MTDNELKQKIKEAAEDVEERMNCKPFDYDEIEEIMLEHGLEMDYIADVLMSM